MCLTDAKNTPARPTGFCMQLRKYINNSFIKKVEQVSSERIAHLILEKKQTFHLYIELFSKGNIILTDSEHTIITSLSRQIWKDRVVKPGEKYVVPRGFDWKNATAKEFDAIFAKSTKDNVVTSLATEAGLGGVYATEVCMRTGTNQELSPSKMKTSKDIVKGIKVLLKEIEVPKAYVYEKDMTPIALVGQEVVEVVDSYHTLINRIKPFEKTSPYEKKISTIKRMIEQQEQAIVRLQAKIDTNTQKGNDIYEHYPKIQKLLDAVSSMRKEKEWKDVEVELKKLKKIKRVDLKKKSVVIDI